MILRAKFENILSFNSETEISFIAGKGTSLPAHVFITIEQPKLIRNIRV